MEERALDLVQPDPRQVGLVRLVDSPQAIKAAWDQFQELKRQLLTPADFQEIQGRTFVKKSGWRKLAAAFGVSLELLREERVEYGPVFAYDCHVRATAPNGRYADGIGTCDNGEPRFRRNTDHVNHDVRSTAYTRAANRAVSDLIGGGEVSAEELDGNERRPPATPRQPPRPAPPAEPVDPDAPASDAQLRSIRQHLLRAGLSEATACQQSGVERLQDLSRELAAEMLRRLSREPNAS